MRWFLSCLFFLWVFYHVSEEKKIGTGHLYANPPHLRESLTPPKGRGSQQTSGPQQHPSQQKQTVARFGLSKPLGKDTANRITNLLALLKNWIERPYKHHPDRHWSQIQALLQQNIPSVLLTNTLHPYLKHGNWQVRQKAAYTLSWLPDFIKDREVLLALCHQARHDAHWRVRQEAMRALGNTATTYRELVLPTILYGLQKDTYWQVRDWAAYGLGQLGAGKLPAQADLKEALNDPSWQVRSRVAHALQLLGAEHLKPSWVEALGQRLLDREPVVQFVASQTLSRLGAVALPVLIAVSKTSPMNARKHGLKHVLRALATHARSTPQALDILRNMLGNHESDLVLEAASALSQIGEKAAGAAFDLARLFKHKQTSVRLMASWALQQIGKAAVPALQQQLLDPDHTVKQLAAETLGLLGTKLLQAPESEILKSVGSLVDLFLVSDWSVRREAAWALFRLGPRAAQFIPLSSIPVLINAVQDKQWSVRYCIVHVLGWKGSYARMIIGWFDRPVSTVGVLEQLMNKDPVLKVRQAARIALARVRGTP